ncbi:MAG: hypothetical protein HPY81_06990 [Firmicutes bacterium]|nr:hypothetical protein [Bacillota bacterium]
MPTFDRRTQFILLLFLAALLFGAGVKYAQLRDKENSGMSQMVGQLNEARVVESRKADASGTEKVPARVTVHVVGAVEKPGVYQLPAGTRVFEAIEQARALPEANLEAINLAEPLNDGQKVTVPRKGESLPGTTADVQVSSTRPGSKVNLNTATAAELDARLPGVGPTLAQRIVDYRNQHGKFRSIEDLKNVSGIGEKRFQELKDLITVY